MLIGTKEKKTTNLQMVHFFKGHFTRTLGKLGDKETENEVILVENDILHHEFPEAVLDCLPKLPWTITEEVC